MKRWQKIILSVWPLVANCINPIIILVNTGSGGLTAMNVIMMSALAVYILVIAIVSIVFYQLMGKMTRSICAWVGWSFLIAFLEFVVFAVFSSIQFTIGA